MCGTKRTTLALSASLLTVSLLLGARPEPALAGVTVYATADTQAPTAPTNFRSTAVTGTTVALAWNASTDNVGVAGYDIYRSKTKVGTTSGTTFTVTGLSPTSKYSFSVRAKDAAGNQSSAAYLTARTTAATADTTPPTAPANLRATAVGDTYAALAWDPATDSSGIAAYAVFLNNTQVGTATGTAYMVTGLSPETAYAFTVTGKDPAGNVSTASNVLSLTTSPATPTKSRVVGYYAGWSSYRNFNVTDIDATKLTHINYAFANVTNGTCAVGDPYADTDKVFPGDDGTLHGNFGQLLKLKQAYPQIRTLISVGGWNWSSGFSAAATDATRSTFAAGCVNFIRQYGFDGIDIDWEYPVSGGQTAGQPADKHNFTLLLETLRQQLDQAGATDGRQYLLTIAGAAGSNYLNNTEMDLAHPYLDWINVMTYDFAGPWMSTTSHNAPLYGAVSDNSAIQGYLGKGVPASKLVLGIPFYARGFDNVTPVNNGLNQPYSGLPPGTYDAGVYDYNDLAANAGYVKTQGLGGAMIWELSNDRGRDLLTAVYNGLQ